VLSREHNREMSLVGIILSGDAAPSAPYITLALSLHAQNLFSTTRPGLLLQLLLLLLFYSQWTDHRCTLKSIGEKKIFFKSLQTFKKVETFLKCLTHNLT